MLLSRERQCPFFHLIAVAKDNAIRLDQKPVAFHAKGRDRSRLRLLSFLLSRDDGGGIRRPITLDLYSHVMPGMQADAAEAVDAAIKSTVKPTS